MVFGKEINESGDVTLIGAKGMRRYMAFIAQHIKPTLNGFVQIGGGGGKQWVNGDFFIVRCHAGLSLI